MSDLTRAILLTCLLLLSVTAEAQRDSLMYYFARAREAQGAGDHATFYTMIRRAYGIHPYHPNILYYASVAASLNNRADESLELLKKAIHVNARVDLKNSGFNSIRESDEFRKLEQLQGDLLTPVIHSDTAFVIDDPTLHVECISPGGRDGVFYIGSIHKRQILEVDSKGKLSAFTTSAQDGLTAVFGIKVDKKRNILWACASPVREMVGYDSALQSGVFVYNLKTRKLQHRFTPAAGREHIFGDLTLDNKGDAFVSDSRNNIIFKVNTSAGNLEEFFSSEEFWNIQGLTFSPDNKILYISDYIKGIYALEMSTKKLTRLKEHFDVSTKSVDGLAYYNNSLVAIQNSITPMRVTLYNIYEDGLSGFTVIDRAHPAFNEPTTGCVVGNSFYYVANSLWSGYDEQHHLKPMEQLQKVVILKTNLTDFQKTY